MNTFNKNLGRSFTTEQLASMTNTTFGEFANKTFITFFHEDDHWEKVWFQVLLNDRQIKFDDDLSMEICREKFGHTAFGIADGIQASRGNEVRNNL